MKLDDPIVQWEPTLPNADKVTLRMLANQTTGYPDYETDPTWLAAFNNNPFHIFTYEERLKYAFGRPLQFAPGANWSYAHTNFMILGNILAKIGNKPLDQLLADEVFKPMGLKNTVGSVTSTMPDPALHTFSSERRPAFDDAGQAVLRGGDLLEQPVGNADGRQRDDDDRRPRHHGDLVRDGVVAVPVQL